MDIQIFSKRLNSARKKQRLTMEELAERSGLTKGAISLYEKGERVPLITNVYDIAKALGTSVSYLTGEEIAVDDKLSIIKTVLDKLELESAFVDAQKITEEELMKLEEDMRMALKIVLEQHFRKK